ncbi:MAG: hypothetical protein ACE5JI_19190, partial [Acidobacteriota bacterium]
RIEGIRLWHTLARLSALVSYHSPERERVLLFVISAAHLAKRGGRMVRGRERAYHVGESFQYNVVAWREGESAYALVAQLASDKLVEMAEGFRP